MVRLIGSFLAVCHIKECGQQDGEGINRCPPGPAAGYLSILAVLMRLSGSNIACIRGGREVFHGIGFAVAAGDVLLVTGRNGAGKSSLLRVIAGLLRPADGSLELTGGDANLTIGEQAHYVGHLDAVKPSLTVLENLRFWACYLGSAVTGTQAA